MNTTSFASLVAILAFHAVALGAEPAKPQTPGPKPTHADISFGPHPHQLLDIYLPTLGDAPYPALLWFSGIWKAAKHPANLGFFQSRGIAVIAVQVRTMEDAVAAGEKAPISYVQSDAIRAVQFARHNAEKWNLAPTRLATGGGSQGAQPALFVGCSREWGDSTASDPVDTQNNYDVHSPAWAIGFQRLALAAGAECHVKFPDHPADDPAKDIWEFVAKRLRP